MGRAVLDSSRHPHALNTCNPPRSSVPLPSVTFEALKLPRACTRPWAFNFARYRIGSTALNADRRGSSGTKFNGVTNWKTVLFKGPTSIFDPETIQLLDHEIVWNPCIGYDDHAEFVHVFWHPLNRLELLLLLKVKGGMGMWEPKGVLHRGREQSRCTVTPKRHAALCQPNGMLQKGAHQMALDVSLSP